MASTGQKFRTSMSGFNKKDVTEYIQKMSFEFRAQEARSNDIISAKDSKIAQLEKKLAEFEALGVEYRNRISELEEACAGKDELIRRLEEEPKAPEVNIEELEEKARLYDGMSSQLGEIMIHANKTADGIIQDAEVKAAGIIATASQSAGAIRQTMLDRTAKLTSELRYAVQNVSRDYCDRLIVELTEVRDQVSQSIISVAGKSEQISQRSAQLKELIDGETEALLVKMEKEASEIGG